MDYHYSEFIDPYINKILHHEIEYCQKQELMIKNIVIPVLERDDVYIDEEKIKAGLSLQKYFPYKLLEWEIFLFALIAGVFLKSGDIFFNVIEIIVGRGSGKNGFISFLAFYFISPYHGVRGYNVDLLANSEEQAQTSFNDVFEVIKNNHDKTNGKALKKFFDPTRTRIKCKTTESVLRFNTSSKKGKDSKRTGAVIYDEKHEYTDSTNINTLRSGLGKVPFGREISITTNGHIRGGVLDADLEEANDILKEYDPENRTLVFWCQLDKEEEWNDSSKWIKAIPSIEDFRDLKNQIKKEVKKMPYTPDYFPEFMAKRMNFPIGNKDVEVATWEDITACNEPLIDLIDVPCVGGVDYAHTDDFVACCLLFKKNNKFYLIHHTFICTKSRDLIGIKAPLRKWEEKGDVTFIDDVEINPKIVADWFYCKQLEGYNIKKIAIDSFRYSLMNFAFKEIGFDAFKKKNIKIVRPSDIMQVSPIINSVFLSHRLCWGNSPIMNWYTNNTKKIMHNGNVTYGKIEENYRKTDGFMAMVSAFTLVEEIQKENVKPKFMKPILFN